MPEQSTAYVSLKTTIDGITTSYEGDLQPWQADSLRQSLVQYVSDNNALAQAKLNEIAAEKA